MPGAKNIKVFVGRFGLDKKSQAKEIEICQKIASDLAGAVTANHWEWSSDKTSFWVDNKNHYFTHDCKGECDDSFDYPIPLKRCLVCGKEGMGITKKKVRRTSGLGQNTPIGRHMEYHLKQASEDVKDNPRPEEGAIDWDYLRDNMEDY